MTLVRATQVRAPAPKGFRYHVSDFHTTRKKHRKKRRRRRKKKKKRRKKRLTACLVVGNADAGRTSAILARVLLL